MSEHIFLSLFEQAHDQDTDFPVDFEIRWITRLSDADANLMSKCSVIPLRLSLLNSAVVLKHEADAYFCIAGFSNPETLPGGLTRCDLTPGMFANFVIETEFSPVATAAEIKENVVGYSNAVTDYDGHDLSVVSALFPKIDCFELDQTAIYASNIERLVGAYLARGYQRGPLHLHEETRLKFASFFETAPETVPFALPLRGLLSFTWSTLFLELYRCIEQLYSVPKLVELTKSWNSERTLHELSKLLDENLGWRPKEDNSLELLFRSLDADHCKSLRRAAGGSVPTGDDDKPWESAAKRIYSLRNANVHFRPTTEVDLLSDDQWNEVICLLLRAVTELYEKFGPRLHDSASKLT